MRHVLLAALVLYASPVVAGATGWVELAPDTRVRLITSDTLAADGTTLAAIELDMPMNTKTYWSTPGETGIPAQLDLSRSRGILDHTVLWPFPSIEQQGGYTDFVYYGPLVVPFRLTVGGDDPLLEADLLMGICSDICVPAMASFSLALSFVSPDAAQGIRIAQALADVPLPWDGADDPIPQVRWDASEEALLVRLDPLALDPASLIADGSATGHLFGAPQKSPQDGLVLLPLLGGGEADGLVNKAVTLVFMTPNGPFSVSRTVKAST